ncbi:hypothetical protein SAMN05443549_1192 [Flavobacterium fluvii]|uniref:HNH endonuclease n=1 Tax=Flavobacterium fluvii TaxID=468056 RepID=A0A1M5Q3D3_9FLAO|nr:hypothetical protein [Flavobacterium fluvii]SHH08604.1 hypothetical protein SAMN05443549_1192 [Flavobacterium fluvii]
MLPINDNLPNIKDAKDYHYKIMRYFIKRKLNGDAFTENPPIAIDRRVNKVNGIKSSIVKFLNEEDNLKKVLIGNPKELDTIKDKFTSKGLKKSLKTLISYDSWIKTDDKSTYRYYNAYHLAEKLDIPTCVYCNRIYTKTVINSTGKKVTRPTFDHWFPKSDYPLLALSFYNLVPSCSVCNSGVKGSTPFSLSTHFHPYHNNPDEEFKYTFSYDHKDYDKFSFKLSTDNKFSEDSVNAFELEEIFKAHEDEIEDLRRIKDAYSEDYIDMLESKILDGITLDRDDVYRLAFGVHFQEAKFDRRPLSKMKKDILIELGIIKTN